MVLFCMKNSTIQKLVTFGLVIVLSGIVGGYIYLGMQQAKTAEITTTPTVDETGIVPTTDATTNELTLEEKTKMLEALADHTTSSDRLSPEERTEILEALESSSTEPDAIPLTAEEKFSRLQKLNQDESALVVPE